MPASRSLIALLIGTVAFFALWLFALKGGTSSSTKGGSSSSQGLGQYQSDINQAHQAVATSNASNSASGNDGTPSSGDGSAASTQPSAAAQPASAAGAAKSTVHVALPATGAQNTAAPRVRLSTVEHALAAHKVVAMLFYNPAAADDQATKQELAEVPTQRGQVVKLSIPLSQAARFTAVTQQVPLNLSPTLVLIAPNRQAGEIVGFADQFEIAQRVDDALAAK